MATTFSAEKCRRFAVAYMRTRNRAAAYRATLENPDAPNYRTAVREGHRLYHCEGVQKELARLREQAAARAVTSLGEWLANELRIARFDIAELFDEHGNLLPLSEIDPDARAAIKDIEVEEEQVEVKRDGDVETTTRTRVKKIRVHSKDGAQDRLARHLGAYERDNEQQNPIMRLLDRIPAGSLAMLEEVLRGCIGDAGAGGKASTGGPAPSTRGRK